MRAKMVEKISCWRKFSENRSRARCGLDAGGFVDKWIITRRRIFSGEDDIFCNIADNFADCAIGVS